MHYPVLHTAFLVDVLAWADLAPFQQLVARVELGLKLIEAGLCPGCGKAVTVNSIKQRPGCVPEQARAGDALSEAQADHGAAGLLLPPVGGNLRPVHVLQQQPASALVVLAVGGQCDESPLLGSHFALNYALEMSMSDSWTRLGDGPPLHLDFSPSKSVTGSSVK